MINETSIAPWARNEFNCLRRCPFPEIRFLLTKYFLKNVPKRTFGSVGAQGDFGQTHFFIVVFSVLHFLVNCRLSFLDFLFYFSGMKWMSVFFLACLETNWGDFSNFWELRARAVFSLTKPRKHQKFSQIGQFSTKLAQILRKCVFLRVVWIYKITAWLDNFL